MPSFVIAALAGAVSVAIALVGSAASWDSLPGYAGAITIEAESFGPSMTIPGASRVWVLYAPTMSLDCSPPRGCYATTQRILYNFSCVAPRYAVQMERISMDLNGNVIKHETRNAEPGYATASDAGAVRVLETFCRRRDRDERP